MKNGNDVNRVAAMMIEAYVKVYGIEKWHSLTAEQQHDVIMTLVRDTNKALGRLTA